jgi:hypothetical protein
MTRNAGAISRPGFSRWRLVGWGLGAALLAAPLLAMQISDEMDWDLADFALAAALVIGVGVALELVARRATSLAYRAGAGLALATAVFLVWANAAVGIIGREDNPANRMYAGVLAVGAVGAVLARLRPGGMALALVATAVAQVAADLIALASGLGSAGPVTAVFAALWLGSAGLFRKAARDQGSATLRGT